MGETVREALDDRLNFRAVISWVVLLGVLVWVFDEPVVQIGLSLVTAAVGGITELLSDVYDLRSAVGSLALGGIGLLGASALTVFGGGAVGLVLALVSGWIALDAGQILRHEGFKTDEKPDRDGHEVYQEYVTRRVDERLREEGMTRRELSAALDADDAIIDRALATLDDRGLLSRHGSELRVSSPPKPDGFGRVPSGAGRLVTRLARPVTLELETDSGDAGTRGRPGDEPHLDTDRQREREPPERH